MRAITYLYVARLKGWLRRIMKHPSQLLILVFIVSVMVMSMFNAKNTNLYSMFSDEETGELVIQGTINMVSNYITIAIWAITLIIILTSMFNAVKKGIAKYSMADVQFIMTAPFKTQNVLLYGMLNQIATTAFSGVIIIFFAPILKGIGFTDTRIWFLVFGIILITICVQTWKQAIYVMCTRKKELSRIFKKVIITLALVIMGGGLVYFLFANGTTEGLAKTLSSNIFIKYFPVLGWAANLLVIAFKGDFITAILPIVLLVVSATLALVYTYSVDVDFYEDATNSARELAEIQEKVENNSWTAYSNKKHKVRKKGLGGGQGESTFFYLHFLETRRKKTYFVGFSTLVYTAVAIAIYFIFKDRFDIDSEQILFIYMGIIAYFMYFLSMRNPVISDMAKPYFYYLPGKSYKKVFYSSLTPVIYTLIDTLPAMIILYALFKIEIPILLFGYMAIAVFNFFYMGLHIYVFSLAGSSEGIIAAILTPLFMLIGLLPAVICIIFTMVFVTHYGAWLYLLGILVMVIYILLFYAGSVVVASWRLKKGLNV